MKRIYIFLTLIIGIIIGSRYDHRVEARLNTSNTSTYSQFLGNIGTTTVSSCGTGSPSVVGDNTKGVISVGTVATSCTLNFSHTLSVTPGCVFSPSIGALTLPTLTITTSSAVINFGAQAIGGGKISYWCFDPTARF